MQVGYIAYPDYDAGACVIGAQLRKVQDCVPICVAQLCQLVALAALTQGGDQYVAQRVASLDANRATVRRALEAPLGAARVKGGEGAIYFWVQLPEGCDDDEAVIEWLVRQHGIGAIPGSSCGAPGHLRIGFGAFEHDVCQEAASRLQRGLEQIVADGLRFPAASSRRPLVAAAPRDQGTAAAVTGVPPAAAVAGAS